MNSELAACNTNGRVKQAILRLLNTNCRVKSAIAVGCVDLPNFERT
ncbi:MAG TPA: hypothetical protein IGS40_00120 [Trichormus sp. M33_DOE_039]|nr:hypothetical protein [Trichormus sp. M33_DOE_039]